MSSRIGLFGGTFNPVHIGHQSIAESFLRSSFIEELWVLLTPFPPHKETGNQTEYEIRLKMLKAAFSNIHGVKISTIEKELPQPSFSIRTIRHLKEKYHDKKFYWCIGGDSLSNFHKWYSYNEVLEECELLVAKRPGSVYTEVENHILNRTHFIEHSPISVSSSQIRQKIANRESVDDLVPRKVLNIIEKEQLYS